MTISCKQAAQLLSEGLDRNLPLSDRLRLYTHLAVCRGCRSIGERFAFLRRAMQEIADTGDSGAS
jgi:predicted anti-sigma-YlaC factor YlaD